MPKICIDPGHPSYLRGTQEVNWGCVVEGVKELELNLAVAILLRDILEESGFSVILTRDNNTKIVSSEDRAKIARDFHADLFFRIHANRRGSGDISINGTRTIYPSAVAKNIFQRSHKMAKIIHQEIVKRTGLTDMGTHDENIAARRNEFGMLTGTYWANNYKIPTVLLEMVYLSNPENRAWIVRKENQELMARAIAAGIERCFMKVSP